MARTFGIGGKCILVGLALIGLAPIHSANATDFQVLYAFKGAPDGAGPYAGLVTDKAGNFYGTTNSGGQASFGSVFKLGQGGSETVLHSFTGGNDGSMTSSALIADKRGNFYGMTSSGGSTDNCGQGPFGCGTVFELKKDGHEKVLHVFTGGNDGAQPLAALMSDAAGNMYGTTLFGGSTSNCGLGPNGCGTVFKIAKDGTETVLHAFAGTDGAYPLCTLIADSNGNLYGTVLGIPYGGVFKLAPDGTLTVLYGFKGGADGSQPQSGLISDSVGNLYGATTFGGGTDCNGQGCGTIYKLAPNGTETVLYAFKGGSDGAFPAALPAVDSTGNLYGTTVYGGSLNNCGQGATGCGTVYKIKANGAGSLLHSFSGGSDGALPWGALLLKKDYLYGTAEAGGLGDGTVFVIRK